MQTQNAEPSQKYDHIPEIFLLFFSSNFLEVNAKPRNYRIVVSPPLALYCPQRYKIYPNSMVNL
jgi:hypothetical protein